LKRGIPPQAKTCRRAGNSARTRFISFLSVVAQFIARQKQRGLNSAKTEVNNAVADFSLHQNNPKKN